jgi:hypothetical protein
VHRSAITLATVFATVLLLVLPFFGGAAPSPISDAANADSRGGFLVSLAPAAPTDTDIEAAVAALKQQESVVVIVAAAPAPTADAEHLAQKPVPPPAPPARFPSQPRLGTASE